MDAPRPDREGGPRATTAPRPPSPPRGFCVWLTGLPSAGKTTIASRLRDLLEREGWPVELLDGDEIRRGLSADLGFDRVSREHHAMRVAFVASVLARHGVVSLVALISPYRATRDSARERIGQFVEVYVDTPLSVCERRDVKGLYRRARRGELHQMTGVDDPYEPPLRPEIVVSTDGVGPDRSAAHVRSELRRLGWLPETARLIDARGEVGTAGA